MTKTTSTSEFIFLTPAERKALTAKRAIEEYGALPVNSERGRISSGPRQLGPNGKGKRTGNNARRR